MNFLVKKDNRGTESLFEGGTSYLRPITIVIGLQVSEFRMEIADISKVLL